MIPKTKSNIIDISWPISENMTAYKDRRSVTITSTKQWQPDKVRESTIAIGSHSGTHIDAPAHFVEHGQTVDQIDLHALIGPCTVYDVIHCDQTITAKDIEKLDIQPGSRVLLKTKNSLLNQTSLFDASFVYVSADGAQALADKKILSVGIDYLGIERAQPNHETHSILLTAGIIIIEGLRLGHVQAGTYDLCCLPLCLPGLDAAPARAVLFC